MLKYIIFLFSILPEIRSTTAGISVRLMRMWQLVWSNSATTRSHRPYNKSAFVLQLGTYIL